MGRGLEKSILDTQLVYSCGASLRFDDALYQQSCGVGTVVLDGSEPSRFRHPVLLPAASHSKEGAAGGFTVAYDTTDVISLDKWIGFDRDSADLRILVSCLANLIDYCLHEDIPLMNIDLDSRCIFFYPPHQRFYFILLPVKGMQPSPKSVRAFLLKLPSMANPADEQAKRFCEQWEARLRASFSGSRDSSCDESDEGLDFQWCMQVLEELSRVDVAGGIAEEAVEEATGEMAAPSADDTTVLDCVDAITPLEPQVHAEASATETTVLVDVFPVSVQVEVRNVADDSTARSEREWTRGKHLRQDPGTGVLNSIDLVAVDSEEELMSLVGSTREREELSHFGMTSQNSSTESSVEANALASVSHEKKADDAFAKPLASKVAPTSQTYVLVHQRTNRQVMVSGGHFVVGKSKNSSYQVPNTTTVSRSHAVFVCEPDYCWIIDDHSKNGTFVNDHRLEPHKRMALQQGDVIRMSDETFVFEGSRQITSEVR